MVPIKAAVARPETPERKRSQVILFYQHHPTASVEVPATCQCYKDNALSCKVRVFPQNIEGPTIEAEVRTEVETRQRVL